MTDQEEAQLRAILDIEGFTPQEIEATLANARINPIEAGKWSNIIRNWRLVTGTKQ